MVRTGYKITISTIEITSEKTGKGDLISLEQSNDVNQSGYTLDLIINNKDQKYLGEFTVGSPVDVALYIYSTGDDNIKTNSDGTVTYTGTNWVTGGQTATEEKPLRTYNIFSGNVQTVDWNYYKMHITAGGSEKLLNEDATAKGRVYHELTDISQWAAMIQDLVKDHNGNMKFPTITDIRYNADTFNSVPAVSNFEIDSGQTYEVVMDEICMYIGASYFTEVNSDGTTTLWLISTTAGATTEATNLTSLPGVGLIYDSAARNEIGFVSQVIVHGSPMSHNDEAKLIHGTTTVIGKYPDTPSTESDSGTVSLIDIYKPNVHTETECRKLAQNIYNMSSLQKNTAKPTFTNIAPKLGTRVSYTDPLTGEIITGQVVRRHVTLNASSGLRCDIELGTTSVSG